MPADPILTDEELAEMDRLFRILPSDHPISRLIAALRAERRRVDVWREGAQRIATERDQLRAEAEELRVAVNDLWGWMGSTEVLEMRKDEPDLVELAQRAHERVCHGGG